VNDGARKWRMGMLGGGEGAFIGAVHRIAAAMDGQIELVCGCFSSDPERSQRAGQQWFLNPERVYSDYQQMMACEAALPADHRMDFVVIVTPNHLHLPMALAALEQGFHVFCDKPATLDVAQALQLQTAVERTGLQFGLAHTYLGYPMVQEARRRIAAGELGPIRKVVVEYFQGWLADDQETQGNKQAAWRTDPQQAGGSCTMGDIGVHAFNLLESVCGLDVTALCADVRSTVPGRLLDDDGSVMLQLNNGARGVLLASQVATGEENHLRLRVYGERAGLEWSHQDPNSLWLKFNDQPQQCLRTAGAGTAPLSALRTPAGQPEGYLEAFANLYRSFIARLPGGIPANHSPSAETVVSGVAEALRGMQFIETVITAGRSQQKWHPFMADLTTDATSTTGEQH